MSNFKLKIEGLKELKKDFNLSARSFDSYEEHIAGLVMNFHYSLAIRTSEVFNTPAGGLSEVLIGKMLTRERFGKNLSRFGLQYRDKAIRLDQFPFTVQRSTATSKAPLVGRNGKVIWKQGRWSSDILVQVRRGNGRIESRNGNNVFEVGRGNNQEGSGQFAFRTGKATWNEFPTYNNPGVRAEIATPFGPSLAQMANGVFKNDASIQRKYNKMAKDIMKTYENYFLNK